MTSRQILNQSGAWLKIPGARHITQILSGLCGTVCIKPVPGPVAKCAD